MSVTTTFVALGSSWTALNAAASVKPVTLMATGGPIVILLSSAGAPATGGSGMFVNPGAPVVPLGYATTTAYVTYAMAAGGQTGAGVWVITGD